MNNTFRINENLIVDESFRDFLFATKTKISSMILSFNTLPDINYISITDKIDTISYLPFSKQKDVEYKQIDPFSDGIGRVNIKIGRMIFKIFPKKLIETYIIPPDVEEFVNLYKSFFDESNRKFIIVSGKEIKQYYLDRNYANPQSGTLWKSCMRYNDRQSFLSLYTKNPDKIKMLVLLVNEDGVDKVRGRSLLWEEVEDIDGNKLKIMDRIYTIFDSDIFIFKRWARENGYISKYYQNAKTQNVFDINNEKVNINLCANLSNHILNYYPYLDTFQFYNDINGKFYNSPYNNYSYTLIQADGSLYHQNEDEDVEMDIDEDAFDPSDF